jgi:hypothetical protein
MNIFKVTENYSQNVKLRSTFLAINSVIGYRKKIWLFGHGRSGTTWISNLINHDHYFREVFEPLHPKFIPESSRCLKSHTYLKADEENDELKKLVERCFSGRLAHKRTDAMNKIHIYQGLLVKDITSNLFANWIYHQHIKNLHMIMIIRNPFSVAKSTVKLKWQSEPMNLYKNRKLRCDFLEPYEDVFYEINAKNDPILKNILCWSVLYHVPLKQFKNNQIKVLFYENVLLNPAREIANALNKDVKIFQTIPENVINHPSRVSINTIENKQLHINSWCNELSKSTIDKGLDILSRFGLMNLYDDNFRPKKINLDNF